MQSNKDIGKMIKNQMMNQILQYKQLAKVKTSMRYQEINQKIPKLFTPNLKQQIKKKSRPQSALTNYSVGRQSKRSCSAERLLKIYELKSKQQLKNPFHKIHVNRSKSSCFVSAVELELSPPKQSDRYQKIKEYYEAKYLSKQHQQNFDVNIVENQGLKQVRPQTGHRNYRFHRKMY